jgi:hypothetical protein
MERKSEPPVGNGAASRDEPIAIVGLGGVFPGARTLQEFWQIVERGTDVSRPVPAGRWILEPQQILQPTAAPDRVYTDRGCFVEGFQLDPTGLDLPQALLAALDPAIHLLLEAGRSAFASARTQATDRRRVGVVLGNIALPTEGASRLCEDVLAGEARKSEGNPRSVIRSAAVDPGQSVADATACATSDFGLRTSDLALRRYVSGLPAGVLAQALGFGRRQLHPRRRLRLLALRPQAGVR